MRFLGVWWWMIEPDPEKRLKQIESLELCPGWSAWMVPLHRERMEAIKEELLADLGEAETARLRQEYRWIKGLLGRPAAAKGPLLRKPAGPVAGNGAV